jgi:hypothetical protein
MPLGLVNARRAVGLPAEPNDTRHVAPEVPDTMNGGQDGSPRAPKTPYTSITQSRFVANSTASEPVAHGGRAVDRRRLCRSG